jgi:hypothetical protein
VLLRLQELRRLRSLERAYGNLAPLFQTAAFRESAEPFPDETIDHSGFSSAEIAVNRFFKPVTYILAAVYRGQAGVGLDFQALGAQELAMLD